MPSNRVIELDVPPHDFNQYKLARATDELLNGYPKVVLKIIIFEC